jgi:hypothetical protein
MKKDYKSLHLKRGFLFYNIFIIMKKINRLSESDLTRIVESVLNERRVSASDLIKDMTLRDVADIVNAFTSKTISLKEVKEEIEYKFRNKR